jgi:hypothetical protein
LGHEPKAARDWQVPDLTARAMAVPQACSLRGGCHPRAKERRRHQIKGQRTLQRGRAGNQQCPRPHPR